MCSGNIYAHIYLKIGCPDFSTPKSIFCRSFFSARLIDLYPIPINHLPIPTLHPDAYSLYPGSHAPLYAENAVSARHPRGPQRRRAAPEPAAAGRGRQRRRAAQCQRGTLGARSGGAQRLSRPLPAAAGSGGAQRRAGPEVPLCSGPCSGYVHSGTCDWLDSEYNRPLKLWRSAVRNQIKPFSSPPTPNESRL